jgi:hypothetical protein
MAARPWLVDGAALALLALVVLIFFGPVVTGRAWLPRGGGDLVSFVYPMYRFAAASLREGQIPLWNPYQYAGAPFLADNQSGVFYPFNLILFLIRSDFSYQAIQALVIWHFAWAAAAMYGCLRGWRPLHPLGRWPALAGALVFALSDLFITHIGNLNLIAVAAWLPLALLGLHRAIEAEEVRPRWRWLLLSGVATGFGILAGHGQMTFMTVIFLGSYALYRAVLALSDLTRGQGEVETRRKEEQMMTVGSIGGRAGAAPLWRQPLRPLLLLLVSGIVAFAVSAIALLPALEMSGFTLRAEFDFVRSTGYSLPPPALTGLFAPDFFGRGSARFWGDWQRVEAGYAGVLPWLLALLALALRPRRETLFFSLGGLFFLLLALGQYTPLYGWFYTIMPLPFQAPARFVLLLNFCLAFLTAVGSDALMKQPPTGGRRRYLAVLAVVVALLTAVLFAYALSRGQQAPDKWPQMARAVLVFAVLAGGGWLLIGARLSGKVPAAVFGALVVLWLAIDLVGLGRYVEIEWNDPAVGYRRQTAVAFLQSDPGIHRIEAASGAWQASAGQMFRLYEVGGVYNPLQLAVYTVYAGSVGYRGSPLYNLMGVKYVIGDKHEPPGDTNFIVPVFAEDTAVDIYLNTRALPRVMLLYRSQMAADHDDAFALTHAGDFDPAQVIVLEEGPALDQAPGDGQIQILAYDANRAAFAITTDRPAYFFLSDTYHPHWQAAVNGQPAPILRANYAFRAVYLEAGTHRLEMDYRPGAWRVGVVVSLVGWLGLLMAWKKL